MIALFGGPAGSGKSTVARRWCERRQRAVHIELDSVLDFIVAGRVDPQAISAEQAQQYLDSVRACCALARSFAESGYDVAVDDVLYPRPTTSFWIPHLKNYDARVVILYPRLDVLLARGLERKKKVAEHHIRDQHAAIAHWPTRLRVDCSDLSVEGTLETVSKVLDVSQLGEGLNNNDV